MPGGLSISARLRTNVECLSATAFIHIVILELHICWMSTFRAIICQDTKRSDEVFHIATHRLIRQRYLLMSFSRRQTSTMLLVLSSCRRSVQGEGELGDLLHESSESQLGSALYEFLL